MRPEHRPIVCHSMSVILMPTFFSLLSFDHHIVFFFFTYATHELVAIPLLPSQANNCILLEILLFKEDLSELQPFPGKLILGFYPAFLSGLFLKFPGGACPQIPLGSSHLRPYKASCGASKISRPVLSGICPLLLKTVENP